MRPQPHATTLQNTSAQTMRLMRHTAQACYRHLDEPATPAEIRRFKKASEELLLYFAVLDIAITNVAEELKEVGLYRHANKRTINEVEGTVMQSFNALYKKVQLVEHFRMRHSYDNAMIQLYDAIDENILIPAPNRSYSIACALCRLINKHNDSMGRFIIAEAWPIRAVLKKLERIQGVTDKNIDFIIDRTLQSLRK